jgi:hypothetical protein
MKTEMEKKVSMSFVGYSSELRHFLMGIDGICIRILTFDFQARGGHSIKLDLQ